MSPSAFRRSCQYAFLSSTSALLLSLVWANETGLFACPFATNQAWTEVPSPQVIRTDRSAVAPRTVSPLPGSHLARERAMLHAR